MDTAGFNASCKSKRDGNADDEKKKREDEIRGRPAMPFGVFEWPVDTGPRAGIIYQDHSSDSNAAENVERD